MQVKVAHKVSPRANTARVVSEVDWGREMEKMLEGNKEGFFSPLPLQPRPRNIPGTPDGAHRKPRVE